MLSEAKHLGLGLNAPREDLKLKAWPRGLRPLRCSFTFAQNDNAGCVA